MASSEIIDWLATMRLYSLTTSPSNQTPEVRSCLARLCHPNDFGWRIHLIVLAENCAFSHRKGYNRSETCRGKGKGRGKVHPCTGTEALYRPGFAQRAGRGITILFLDNGTRTGWGAHVEHFKYSSCLITNNANVYMKLKPGLPWPKQHSTRRLITSKLDLYLWNTLEES